MIQDVRNLLKFVIRASLLLVVGLNCRVVSAEGFDFKAYNDVSFVEVVEIDCETPEISDIELIRAPDWLTSVDLGNAVIKLTGTPDRADRGPNIAVVQCTAGGKSKVHNIKIDVGTGFDAWLAEHLPEGQRSIDGDPDGDDTSNVWEYIHGRSPNWSDATESIYMDAQGGDGGIRFNFYRRKLLNGVVLTPQWTDSLTSEWSSEGLSSSEPTTVGERELHSCTWSEPVSAPKSAFFRLTTALDDADGENSGYPNQYFVQASRSDQIVIQPPAFDDSSTGWQFALVGQPASGVARLDPNTGYIIYDRGSPTPPYQDSIYYTATAPDGEVINGEILVNLSEEVSVNLPIELINVPEGDEVTVIVSSEGYLFSLSRIGNGFLGFNNLRLKPDIYQVKAYGDGLQFGDTRQIKIGADGSVTTLTDGASELIGDALALTAESTEVAGFNFHWEDDVSVSGAEYSAYVNTPPEIVLTGITLEPVNHAAAQQLRTLHNIILDDRDVVWTQEHASRLLQILKRIPQGASRDFRFPHAKGPTLWTLTDDYLSNDIEINTTGEITSVRISAAAFVNANPRIAEVDGRRGIWYSKRLHNALVRYVTEDGNSRVAIDRILSERFNVSTHIPDYLALTASTTQESAAHFQDFSAEEHLTIIEMFEEMPTGYHRIPGLNYLVRRVAGHPHPLHPQAPAVAWVNAGYIEFMDTAFTANIEHVHRLMVHEKAHFIWALLLAEETKTAWIDLGQWWQDEEGSWFTSSTTEFVSGYAHLKNPNEDFAESVSYFILNPDKLKARSLPKYEFIRDRIMQGNFYLSQIREDLTFEVYNLYPDYIYPGKVSRVDINVLGEPEEDKTVTVEVELASIDQIFEGAKDIYLRMFSEIGTYYDVRLMPSGTTEDGIIFRKTFTISRFAKSGYWVPEQFRIRDSVGNNRFEDLSQFGWMLHVDNPLEDLMAPEFVPDSHSIEIEPGTLGGNSIQWVTAKWQFVEDSSIPSRGGIYGRIVTPVTGERINEYGTYTFLEQTAEGLDLYEASVRFMVTDYHPSGDYGFSYLFMEDVAVNRSSVSFTEGFVGTDLITFSMTTATPDLEDAELDLNTISIEATPVNPEFPDGETIVEVTYQVRDNLSGLGKVSFRLRDPQGTEHFYYHYHDNFHTDFFVGEATEWKTYIATVLLPKGSAPGTWGLSSMDLMDKALNRVAHSFVEIVHFDILD